MQTASRAVTSLQELTMQQTFTSQIIETSVVFFLNIIIWLFFFLTWQRPASYRWWEAGRWGGIVFLTSCIALQSAFCVCVVARYAVCQPVTLLVKLWQLSGALTPLILEMDSACKTTHLHETAKSIARPLIIIQVVVVPPAVYAYFMKMSDILWSLALPTHVSILLISFIPIYNHYSGKCSRQGSLPTGNWFGTARRGTIVVISLGLLIRSCICNYAIGHYLGQTSLTCISVLLTYWRTWKENRDSQSFRESQSETSLV